MQLFSLLSVFRHIVVMLLAKLALLAEREAAPVRMTAGGGVWARALAPELFDCCEDVGPTGSR